MWPVSALDGGRFPSLWRLSVGHTFRKRGTDLGRRRRSLSSGDIFRFLVTNMRSFVDQANCNEIELDLEDESNRTYLGKNTPMDDQ